MSKLSIVIPVYFNDKNLLSTYTKLKTEVLEFIENYELIFVDDGSRDDSYAVMETLRREDEHVKLIKLSRNFGQHAAILAGLSHMTGDCAAVISADLQDPPVLIREMYGKWQNGSKTVIAIRIERCDNRTEKFFSAIYYKIMKKYVIEDMPKGGFDCFLADKQVIQMLVNIDEKNTSLFAQVLWLGFERSEILYKRHKREIGLSTWTFSKKIKLFIDSFLAFSYLPIRLISVIGLLDCLLSLIIIVYLIIHKIIVGNLGITGWSSLMVAIIFTSGVQMLTLGVIGEYLWRNFDATRNRPSFIIDKQEGFD